MAQEENQLYAKDAEGNTYAVGISIYEGRIMTHDQHFGNIAENLRKLPDFKVRPDDVWVMDYMKSGK